MLKSGPVLPQPLPQVILLWMTYVAFVFGSICIF